MIPIDLPRPRRSRRASGQSQVSGLCRRHREDDGKSGRRGGARMKALTSIPGRAAADRLLRLLVAWEVPRAAGRARVRCRLPGRACRNCRAILSDPRSLYDILSSVRRMVTGFALAARLCHPGRTDDGPQPEGRGLLQSALHDDLSGAEGGADADHHAVARHRRCLEDAGDLSRRVAAGDLSHLSGLEGGRREAAVVRRRHGHDASASNCCASCCRRRCRKSWSAAAPGSCSR